MIAASRWAKLGAVIAALMGHGGLALFFVPSAADEARLESASGIATARLGAGFADLVAGVQAPEAPQTMTETPTTPAMAELAVPNAALRPLPPEAAPKPHPPRIAIALSPDTPIAPTSPVEPLLSARLEGQTSPEITFSAVPLVATAESPPTLAMAQPPTKPILAEPPKPLATTTAISETVNAQIDDFDGGPKASLRPQARPHKVDAPAKKQKATPRQTAQNQAQAKLGNAEANQRAGAETGAKTSTVATQAGLGRKASQGNAAASNYPGQVLRRISRVRRPKVRARGVAQVAFTIATDGTLASVRIGKSSGSVQLDDAAVQVVRRAAPFPPPPAGVKRAFVIPIKGG